MGGLLQDIRYALRQLGKSPGFTTVTLLTLAIGIGANTAVFSLADLIIRKPVALPEMDRLSVIEEQLPGSEDTGISPANYLDMRSGMKSFDQLAAYQYWSASTSGQGQAEELFGVRVSLNFFSVVGVRPMLGHDFSSDQNFFGSGDQIVISNALSKQHFGSDASAVGATLKLDGKPYTVIGIMPAKATFPLGAPSFWMPLTLDSRMRGERRNLELHSVGRLRNGVSLAQARAEVETFWKHLSELYPLANQNRSIQLVSLHDHIVLDYNRQFALLMTGVLGTVLLIACVNISAIQFARAAKRRSEIAVRAALGAGRRPLFRQLLVESLLLGIMGGAIGVLFGVYGVAFLRGTLPNDVRWFCDVDSLSINLRSLLFTTLVALACGLVSGLAPAWQASKAQISAVLAESAVRVAGRRSHFWHAALILSETALATILLIAATLMAKGFALLATGQPGLAPASLLTFHVDLPQDRYPEAQQVRAFNSLLLDQLQALPKVQSAALASGIPYSWYENSSDLTVRDLPPIVSQGPVAMLDSVSHHYFQTMHISLRAGREFDATDSSTSLPVCIVSQSMAQRLWPGGSAVGKQIRISGSSDTEHWITIVGVVADVQHEIYDRSFRSIVYLPSEQHPTSSADVVIRSEGDPMQLAAVVRSEVRRIDPDLAVENLQSLGGLIRSQARALQYVAGLMSGFAFLGLILACVGVYGVMANSVTERWRDLAVRMALGAHSWNLLSAVMGRAFLFSTIGMGTGLLVSLGLARLLSSLLYGVSAWDGGTFLTVPVFLAAVALLACYVPARRAIRMDPVVALRYE
jgi:putative ABC transport system permease protein